MNNGNNGAVWKLATLLAKVIFGTILGAIVGTITWILILSISSLLLSEQVWYSLFAEGFDFSPDTLFVLGATFASWSGMSAGIAVMVFNTVQTIRRVAIGGISGSLLFITLGFRPIIAWVIIGIIIGITASIIIGVFKSAFQRFGYLR